MIEFVGALKRHVQVPGRQYPVLGRTVISADERRQVGDDAVSRGIRIDPVFRGGGGMRVEPAGVHRGHDEGFRARSRDDPGDLYRSDAAHGHVQGTLRSHPGRSDLPKPFDLHPVGEPHHHGPPIVVRMTGGGGMPEPRHVRAQLHSIEHVLGNGAHFLQQGHVGVHLDQLPPRLVHRGDVPAHHLDHGASSSPAPRAMFRLRSRHRSAIASDHRAFPVGRTVGVDELGDTF